MFLHVHTTEYFNLFFNLFITVQGQGHVLHVHHQGHAQGQLKGHGNERGVSEVKGHTEKAGTFFKSKYIKSNNCYLKD